MTDNRSPRGLSPGEDYRKDYIHRINTVLDYIQKHPDGDLSLDALAARANFSAYHFHRIFKAMSGETLAECVRRIRLQKAAFWLSYQPHRTVTDVAYSSGFGSPAAFTRSFKDFYGVSPSQWVKRGSNDSKINQVDSKLGKAEFLSVEYPVFHKGGADMTPSIEDFEGQRYAYFRAVGPYGGKKMGEAWERLHRWAGPRGLLATKYQSYGISIDDPHITPAEKCRYDACIAIDEDFDASGANSAHMPAGKLAVFPYSGEINGLGEFFENIYLNWLPESGLVPSDAPAFERYSPEILSDMEKGLFSCEICLPVEPAR